MAQDYVCVRIVNVNDLDLNTFPFDYDLTMAIVLAHPDGTVYHRYGGRDHLSPMNIESLVEIMKRGLETHRTYEAQPAPPPVKAPERLSELINTRLRGRINPIYGCFHCHYVREARQTLAMEAGQWTPDQFWIWPLPERVGLVMDQTNQASVAKVLPGSPAERAAIRPGDVLQSLGDRRVLTKYDLQWVLDQSEDEAISIPYSASRGESPLTGRLELESAWKVGDPRDNLWRVRNVFTEHMIRFLPTPGFIGRPLSETELQSAGLPTARFALKISQLNYGSYLAGLRLGDIVLGAAGRADFESTRDFYHWCELLRRSGRDIRMELLRQGSRLQLMVSLSYLNYSKAEIAPQVNLGFIVQELPQEGGLRLGHVTEESGAEKTGLRVGDRVVSVDGKPVRDREVLDGLLNNKSPGDLLSMEVTRDGQPLLFSFALAGREENKSDLARLTAAVAEAGQELDCVVTIKLPPKNHIYSVHKLGFGLPTQLEFRGRGYELVGSIDEPQPRLIEEGGIDPMWVLEGHVELRQSIRVVDPAQFQLLLHVYAQVCDDRSCHELRAIIANHGAKTEFSEFRGRFEEQPLVSRP